MKNFNSSKQRSNLISIGIFCFLLVGALVLYAFGVEQVLKFSPILLAVIFSLSIVLWNENLKKKLITAAVVVILGFIIEIIGVKTGLLFGDYSYGEHLGFKLFGVPLIIGLLWFIVTLSSWQLVLIAKNLKFYEQLSLGVLIILFFDLLLEQFAMGLGFWVWQKGQVPLYNYVCWVVVSTAAFLLYKFYCRKTKPNLFIVSILPILSIWMWLLLLVNTLKS